MPLAAINAIWIGPRLGPLHAACLRSFLRHGHEVTLFCYAQPEDLPVGVHCADAGTLLSSDDIVRHKQTGSLAVFADFLRYELLRRNAGLYVDCDVFCLHPVAESEYLFGYESNSAINNAVLKIPPGSAVLTELCSLRTRRGFVPPWATSRRQAYYRLRSRLGMPVPMEQMPWGFTGPAALTWYLQQHGLQRHAATIDTFYPLHHEQAGLLLDAELRLDDLITPRTRLVHLWSSTLERLASGGIPATSPLGRIVAS